MISAQISVHLEKTASRNDCSCYACDEALEEARVLVINNAMLFLVESCGCVHLLILINNLIN